MSALYALIHEVVREAEFTSNTRAAIIAAAQSAHKDIELHMVQQLMKLELPSLYLLVNRWVDGPVITAQFDNDMTLSLRANDWHIRYGCQEATVDSEALNVERAVLLAMADFDCPSLDYE
jgi:hypothetical protein